MAKEFTCPRCEFRVASESGEDDLMKHVEMHRQAHHPDLSMTKDEARRYTRDVRIERPEERRAMEQRPMERT